MVLRIEHIPVRRKVKISFPKEMLETLPDSVSLFTTAQYIDRLDDMKQQLEDAGKTVEIYRARHTAAPGQILGCSIQTWPEVDAFVYVGEGEFHPRALLFKNPQPTFRYDPLREAWDNFSHEEINKIMKQHKGAMLTFYHSKTIGVLGTTKSGQKDMQAITKLRKEHPKKDFIYFLANTLDWQGLDDFPFVEMWINTGCPRIGLDDYNKVTKPILNAEHVLEGIHSF
jgi:2-(3-amino-3-carboxypropyl)histidine synthase